MGLARNLRDVQRGLEIVAEFPEYRALPIVLTESDPEGCAACSVKMAPQNNYRDGLMYASYTAAAINNIAKLGERAGMNLAGMLTWAFEFEGTAWFDGYRELATNGIDKPVLNVFRMAGMLHGDHVAAVSSGAAGLDRILANGVHDAPDIDVLATRSARELDALVWNYDDDALPAAPARIHLVVRGLDSRVERVLVHHYRIDETHSNAYAAWKRIGAPAQPNSAQVSQLAAAGQLELLTSPSFVRTEQGTAELDFTLPRQGVSLLRFSWE
jgi:xylan 1,4-beta-xylosidase